MLNQEMVEPGLNELGEDRYEPNADYGDSKKQRVCVMERKRHTPERAPALCYWTTHSARCRSSIDIARLTFYRNQYIKKREDLILPEHKSADKSRSIAPTVTNQGTWCEDQLSEKCDQGEKNSGRSQSEPLYDWSGIETKDGIGRVVSRIQHAVLNVADLEVLRAAEKYIKDGIARLLRWAASGWCSTSREERT